LCGGECREQCRHCGCRQKHIDRGRSPHDSNLWSGELRKQ
jgi:hypothetical protein